MYLLFVLGDDFGHVALRVDIACFVIDHRTRILVHVGKRLFFVGGADGMEGVTPVTHIVQEWEKKPKVM